MWLRASGRRSRAFAAPLVVALPSAALLTLTLVADRARAAPPRTPPSPRISAEDGLAISRSARDDRRLGTFTPREDGGLDYEDPKGRFRAQIAEDGKVTFRGDSPVQSVTTFSFDRHGGIPLRGLSSYLRDPEQWKRKPSANDLGSALHGGVADPLTRHLSTVEKTEERIPGQLFLGFGARFGRPVFSDRMKAEFLRDTFEMRLDMAVKAERRRISRALRDLEGQLSELWGTTALPPEERRRLLFELWDECLERLQPVADAEGTDLAELDDLGSNNDERRLRAATEARRRILSFIRLVLPRGSASAYTDDELRRLNRRRLSREPFQPYP